MLHFLICDDVTGMVAAMRVVTKNELGQLGAKATIPYIYGYRFHTVYLIAILRYYICL